MKRGKTKERETPTLRELIRALNTGNPEGGEITVDELLREVPNMNRLDVVNELRNMPNGVFLIGRRGFPSRFVYGKAAKPIAEAVKERKKQYAQHSRNGRTHSVSRNRVTARTEDSEMLASVPLRITIGDVGATIPIKVKIAPVAIAAE